MTGEEVPVSGREGSRSPVLYMNPDSGGRTSYEFQSVTARRSSAARNFFPRNNLHVDHRRQCCLFRWTMGDANGFGEAD